MSNDRTNKVLSQEKRDEVLMKLKTRFEKNLHRHKGINWNEVQARIEKREDKLWSLHEMERTGGEPDVVGLDEKTGEYIFYDCSPESPTGRRNLCYDREALESRKQNKPESSAMDLAVEIGIELLTEEQYRELQDIGGPSSGGPASPSSGGFDLKTSSWIKTPPEIRKLGGALFCDHRYNHVFVYHNGAESYYAARGFRGCLRV